MTSLPSTSSISSLSPSSSIFLLSSTVMPSLPSTVPSESGGSLLSTLSNPTLTVTVPEITVTIAETTVTVPSTTTTSEHRSFPPARSVPTIIPTPLGGTGAAPNPNGPSTLPTSDTSVASSSSPMTLTSTSSLPLETYFFLSKVGRPFSG
ncbi:hypothetical protein B0H65DRAFT_161577 [Neurospora tetraspora]|uniref:Uncharacterized protein n=1 Tax=Neurospora tetraspora TaxID=94610 RepID=A0AAE0JHJ4_9PEZI|nr:hypothetical protein B0H65DRAFT_161577 [Neurospora tetraspora]